MPWNLIIFILAFFGVWFGAGLAIRSVEKLSRSLHLSSFLVSFLVLGFFTSISELSVGVNSLLVRDPEIYVGNLIGASLVLFMLVIPLLSIFGHGIHIRGELQGLNLPFSLITIAIPVLLSIDGRVSRTDGFVSLFFYLLLVILIQSKNKPLEKLKQTIHQNNHSLSKTLFFVVTGVTIIFLSSHFLVEETIYFSQVFGVSPFLISLLVIALGTNIPELSLVLRSAFSKNNQVAFGDYVGSAAFNTFLFAILTIFGGQEVSLNNSYLVSLSFMIGGLSLFYYFARTKNTLSRLEGFVLLLFYICFIFTEVYLHKSAFLGL